MRDVVINQEDSFELLILMTVRRVVRYSFLFLIFCEVLLFIMIGDVVIWSYS